MSLTSDPQGRPALVVEQAPFGIAIFDTKMRYLAVSPHFLSNVARLTLANAFAPAEVIGRSLYETFPKFPQRWREVNSRVLAGEKLAEQEEAFWREDGRIEWVRWSAEPWRTADGCIGGVLAFGEITTDQVQAKRALAESEARFRGIFENAAVGIAHSSPEGKLLRVNQALCRIVGLPADELTSRSSQEITHPDDLAVQLPQFEQLRDGKIDSYHMDKRYLQKDGTIVWGRLTVSCVRKSDGSVDYFVAIVEDISARKRAEETLRRQADLLDQSHDAIFTWKIGDGIAYWNRAAEVLYGYAQEEAIGRRPHDLLRTCSSSSSLQEREARITRDGSWYGELTHTTRDGHEIVVESRHVGVSYDGEPYVLVTDRDITARKRAEDQIRFLMDEATHRAKNMFSLVQVIARQIVAGGPEDFVERFTERIQALATNHELLVRNRWQSADLEELVRSQLAHLADLVGSRIEVHGLKLSMAPTAAQTIGLVLHELATNAVKYGALSTDAGRVDVGWRVDGDRFILRWTERNGPPVRPPERRGFGSTVVDSMAKWSVDGEVQLDYAPLGLEWRLTCPAARALRGW